MRKGNLSIKETFDLAIQHQQKKDLKVAEKLYKEILKTNPNHATAHNNLGMAYQEMEESQKARSCYEKAIQINPDYAAAHGNLGNILKKLGKHQKARSCYEKAIQINPNHADAHYGCGLLFHLSNKYQEHKKAISYYEKAIQINPSHVHAHNNLGVVFRELGEREKAKSYYEKAIQIKPNHAASYNNLGSVLRELGENDRAIRCYQKALKFKPEAINAQANITNIYITQLDDLEKAINASYKTLKMHHEGYKSINQMSLCRLKHDVQQAKYLISKNYKIEGIENFKKVGDEILNRDENRVDNNNFDQKVLLNHHESNSFLPFYKSDHIYQTPKISGSCINPHKNWQNVEEQYFNSPKQIIHIDNFLSEEAIKELRKFCLVSRIWDSEYKNKYLGAFSEKGFISPIHLQIAIELKQKLPKLFGKYNLGKFWAFKYDSAFGKGINIHADFAFVNLNFWITPDEFNKNTKAGGLKVYDVPAPEDWTFMKYNTNAEEIYKYLNDTKANCTNIPYKYNRAVLFNSAYFHETDEINFKDEYEGRRINITYLFGDRLLQKESTKI